MGTCQDIICEVSTRPDPDDSERSLGTHGGRVETRGRPPIHGEDEILEAALRAFATWGYDAMSVRSLNAELGLSHGAVSQRFGSKLALYYAAIDHCFGGFMADIAGERAHRPIPADGLGQLREAIRAFLMAAARRPELGRLMNQEGLQSTERLDYVLSTVLLPAAGPLVDLMHTLQARGEIHPMSARALFFLVAHGAEAPYTLTALSDAFDGIDGALDETAHAELVTDFIVRGLRRR
jgi:AcrR family transcriptional regulator